MDQMLGRHDDALAAYQQARDLDPEAASSSAWRAEGDLLKAIGHNDEALEAYDKAIQLDPEDTCAWRAKGDALRALVARSEGLGAGG